MAVCFQSRWYATSAGGQLPRRLEHDAIRPGNRGARESYARIFAVLRIPVKLITDSGVKPITDSGQTGHLSERSDAGLGL